MLLAADRITNGDLSIDSFWSALGVALAAAAVAVVLDVVFGTNDDDAYSLRVISSIANLDPGNDPRPAQRYRVHLTRGTRLEAPTGAGTLRTWPAGRRGGYTLTSGRRSPSHGASQAGILLGSNEVPAFRWSKETATTMACSAPPDLCRELERHPPVMDCSGQQRAA
jgi:hypothetical protein